MRSDQHERRKVSASIRRLYNLKLYFKLNAYEIKCKGCNQSDSQEIKHLQWQELEHSRTTTRGFTLTQSSNLLYILIILLKFLASRDKLE